MKREVRAVEEASVRLSGRPPCKRWAAHLSVSCAKKSNVPWDVPFPGFGPTSHRQNDAELCIAAHHSRVCLGRFFEWIRFNHGAHAG